MFLVSCIFQGKLARMSSVTWNSYTIRWLKRAAPTDLCHPLAPNLSFLLHRAFYGVEKASV